MSARVGSIGGCWAVDPTALARLSHQHTHLSHCNRHWTELTRSFFKTLTDQVITVELKNDLAVTGTLKSVDQ